MKNYSKFNQIVRSIMVLSVVAIMTFTACVKIDDTLGSGFVPEDQEMVLGVVTLEALEDTKRIFETRLYQTDSIVTSNLDQYYFGSSRNDTMGMRSAGFMSQYMVSDDTEDPVEEGHFGFRPIFDSIQIILSITDYGRDTVTPQKFHVYEVTSNKYLKDSKDSIFYQNFDPNEFFSTGKFIDQEPLFSFTFPDGQDLDDVALAVTMDPTAKGVEYVKRLMISDGDTDFKPGVDYSIYDDQEKWLEEFKGLYIAPAEKPTWTGSKGSVYTTNRTSQAAETSTGFVIYCRNRDKNDPTLIKDTLVETYFPYNRRTGDVLQSINTINHYDFEGSQFASYIDLIKDTNTNIDAEQPNSDIYVDGMGGVVTEITITENFFNKLDAIIAAKNIEGTGDNYRTLAFNKAELNIYFSEGDYDWNEISSELITPLMNGSMSRLGLYTNYKTRTNIADYNYLWEKVNADSELPYGGYINRSLGCYQMNINVYMQGLWNSYVELKEASESKGEAVDFSELKNRIIYLAPEEPELFGTMHAKLQGMEDFVGKENSMKIELVYTLVK